MNNSRNKVFDNLLKMLELRGLDPNLKAIEIRQDNYTIYLSDDVFVLFCKTLNKQMCLYFSSELSQHDVDKGIIVYKNISKTSSMKLEKIDIFKESFFYFDRTDEKSVYYRKHQKVESSPYEKNKLPYHLFVVLKI